MVSGLTTCSICSKYGLVKRTNVCEFENIRKNGKIAITLKENDEVLSVYFTTGNDDIVIASNNGRMVRFNENEIRVMGRTASGVRGINLEESKCICCEIVNEEDLILLVTEKGYGKQTYVREFRQTKRGSKGVKALNITDKNGNLVAVEIIKPDKELVIMTDSGMTMRMPVDQISVLGRVTQGLRLIHLRDNQKVSAISLVDKEIESEDNNEDTTEVNNNTESEDTTQE